MLKMKKKNLIELIQIQLTRSLKKIIRKIRKRKIIVRSFVRFKAEFCDSNSGLICKFYANFMQISSAQKQKCVKMGHPFQIDLNCEKVGKFHITSGLQNRK